MDWKNKFPKENIYFETENGILYNGNCLNIMKQFLEESIDLIVTSPPYNVGIKYENWKDTLSPEKYFSFVFSFLQLFKYILKSDGRFAINILYDIKMKHTIIPQRMSLFGEYYLLLKKAGLKYTAIIDLQEKAPNRIKYTAWGSYLSASCPYIYNPKECVLLGYKNQWKKKTKGNSTMNKDLFIEIVSGIWSYSAETKGITMANFSTDIPFKAINGLSYENDIILDPFMGSGTTGLVCEKTNRKWIGIEISKKYCELSKQRILNEISQTKFNF